MLKSDVCSFFLSRRSSPASRTESGCTAGSTTLKTLAAKSHCMTHAQAPALAATARYVRAPLRIEKGPKVSPEKGPLEYGNASRGPFSLLEGAHCESLAAKSHYDTRSGARSGRYGEVEHVPY